MGVIKNLIFRWKETTIGNISNIFDEELGQPNEWDLITLISGSIVVGNAYNGAKALDLSSSFSAYYETISSITDTTSTIVTVWVKLKSAAPSNWRFHMSPRLNGISIGTHDLFDLNPGGFNRNSLIYQKITFDLSAFSPMTYDELYFNSSNLTDGLYADTWNIEYI